MGYKKSETIVSIINNFDKWNTILDKFHFSLTIIDLKNKQKKSKKSNLKQHNEHQHHRGAIVDFADVGKALTSN